MRAGGGVIVARSDYRHIADFSVMRLTSNDRRSEERRRHSLKGGDPAAGSPTATLLRLRPSHRPYHRRLPPLRVGVPTSGTVGFHGVTGGVYKARERIHRGVLIRDY